MATSGADTTAAGGSGLPSYAELPVVAGAPPGSSWGLWGPDDVFGALNLLTPDRARRGIEAAWSGEVFSLNLEMELPDPPLYRRSAMHHHVHDSGLAMDDELSGYNTQSSTQWDGFLHVRHPVHGWYNGLDPTSHGVGRWARRGIVGRGVLADVGRWRAAQGRPLRCGEGDVIEPAEVTATLAAQGTEVEPGDVLLVRTGWVAWYRGLGADERTALGELTMPPSCGLRASEETAALLWDLHVAAVASDSPAFESVPFGGLTDGDEIRAAFRSERVADVFVHVRLLALLGIPIGEMFDLEALADDCAVDGRHEFLLTSSPLALHGGVGSPANALAIK
jgi:kynurenine formamidase